MGIQTNVKGAPVSSAEIEKVGLKGLNVADTLLEKQPVVDGLVSTDDFYAKAYEIFTAIAHQRLVVAGVEDKLKHAVARNMAERIYTSRIVNLPYTGKTYQQWAADKGFDISKFSKEDASIILTTVFNRITGADNNRTLSVADVQAAMISSMKNINSYAVQYLYQANDGSYLKTDHAMIRLQNLRASGGDAISFNVPVVALQSFKERATTKAKITLAPIVPFHIGFKGIFPLAVSLAVLDVKVAKPREEVMAVNLPTVKLLNQF